ncbi:MAG: DNA-binding protein [Clostridia bacterium]|nr:DNA-binding protein [Clostridia bacterium]
MKKKCKFLYLFDQYPPIITKDQFYRICNVSKKTAAHLLDNGLVPCINSGKKTRKYKIKLEDVIVYLETREVDPGKFAAPDGWYKAKMKPGIKRLVLNKVNIKKIKLYFKNLLYTYPDVLSINQVAEVTGYSTTSVHKWVKTGILKTFDMGNRFVIPKIWLLEFLTGPDFMQTLVHSKYEKERLMKYLNDE